MKKGKKNKNKGLIIILFFSIFVIIILSLYIMYKKIEVTDNLQYQVQKTQLSTNYLQTVDNEAEESKKVADMIEEVTESVVGISKLSTAGGSILNNITTDELGLGTGVIVSNDGYILSNSHVTGEKYSTCYITVNENNYKGTVVWSDLNIDLSIVKIQASNLPYVTLGDSSKLRVGESSYAIGNPIGYEFRRTVTSGIISALNRTIRIDENDTSSYISDLIQTDATINPGNSGGPLINTLGEVIGINTVKITSAEGIGFAIPINVIKPVVEKFKKTGTFEEATLGIYAFDGDIAEYMNLKEKVIEGIYVTQIIRNGPSDNTELKEGDIIKSIDNKHLNTINDLREYIYTKNPGDEVDLLVVSEKKYKTIKIKLDKK